MNIIHVLQENGRILKQFFKITGIFLVILMTGNVSVKAQCPVNSLTVTTTPSSCFGADDATLTIVVDDPNGYAGQYQYSIAGFRTDGPGTVIASFTTAATTHTFTGLGPANISLIGVDMLDDGSCSTLSHPGVSTIEPTEIVLSATTSADCALAGTGSIDLTVSGGNPPYTDFAWSGGLPNQEDHTGTVLAGTYSVTVTDNNGCMVTLNNIVVDGPPDATITDPGPVCEDAAPFNLTAATPGGTWSGTGITDAVLGTFDPGVAGPGLHTVTYDVTSGAGCNANDTQDITVNASPVVNINPVAPVCLNDASFNMTADVVGGTWSGTGITNPVSGAFNPATAGAGVHTITYNFTDGNGCTGTDTFDVTVNPLPDASFTGGPFCIDDAATNLTPATPGGTWSGTGITDAVNGTFDPAVAGVGSHSITYQVTDGNGCTNTAIQNIDVNPLPDATITATAPVCEDDAPFNLTAATGGGTWSGTGITDAVNGTFDPATAGPGVHTITYTVTDGNGCVNSDTEDITVNALPVVNINPAGPVCANDPAFNMTADVVGGTWSGTGITNPVSGAFNPATAGAGVHTITYSFTDGNGCNGTDTFDITVNPLPDASFTGGPFCVNDAATNLTPVTPGGTWSGTGITDASAGTFDPAVAGIGSHSITYQVTDGNGCVNTAVQNIDVNPLPDATITATAPVCEDDAPFNLTAATPGGTWSGTGITDAVNGTFDPATAGPGVHTITYTVTDGNGCINSDTEDVTVNALPVVNIDPVAPVCIDAAPFNMTADVVGGTWSGTGITNPVSGAFNPATAGAGVHTITYSFTDGNGCNGTDTFDVTVNPLPDATITPAGPFCDTDPATNLTAATPGGTWAGTGITDALAGTFDPAVAGAGTHLITYTITDANGCTNSANENIDVSSSLDPTITPVGPVCIDAAPFNLAAATPGGTWSGTGITDAAAGTFDPAVAGIGSHLITYTITSPGGCVSSDNINVDVNPTPVVNIDPVAPVCVDDAPFNMTADVAGGTWSGTGITDAVNGTFDPATAGAGTHTITYDFTDANGCNDSDTFDVTVNPLPDASFAPAGPFCENDAPVNLVPTNPGGTWSGTGIVDAATGTFDPATAGPGSHNITYTLTDANGCSDSSIETIDVNPNPVVTINPVGPVCESDASFNMTANVVGGTWSGTGITNPISGAFNPATAGAGSHTINYNFVDGNGCNGSDSFVVDVNANPQAGLDSSVNACEDDNAFNLFAALGGTPDAGGTWNDDDGVGGLTGDLFDVTAAAIVGNTYDFTYTVTNGACAPASATVSVTIIGQPNSGTGSNGTTCSTSTNFDLFTLLAGFDAGGTWNDDDLTLALSGPGNSIFDASSVASGASYSFTYIVTNPTCGASGTTVTVDVVNSLNAGTAVAANTCDNVTDYDLFDGLTGFDAGGTWNDDDATGALTGNLFDASAVGIGTYNFTYTVSAPGCTDDTEQITVNVSAGTVANAGGDQGVCFDNTIMAATLNPDETGVWSVVAGTGIFADNTDPNTAVSGLTAGVNTFEWTVTNGVTGCIDVASVNVDFKSLTIPNAGPDQVLCTTEATMAGNAFIPAQETGTWVYGGFVVPAPVIVDPNDPNTLITGLIAGNTYDFTWTIQDNDPFGCVGSSDIVTVDVVGSMTVAEAGPVQDICNDNTILAGNAVAAGETGTWTVFQGSGIFADANDPVTSVTGLTEGLNRLVWTITDDGGLCPASRDTVNINVLLVTVANAGPDQDICTDAANMAANAVDVDETGTWSIVSGTGTITSPNDPNTNITGIGAGALVLRWTISDDTGTCPPTQSDVTLNVVGSITAADAGLDQNICADNTLMAANATVAGETGTWNIISGTGIFVDINDPTSAVSGLTVGDNVFEWSIVDDLGSCVPSTDQVTITVGANTTPNAGPDQSICTPGTTLAANTVGIAESGIWTVVAGTGTFDDATNPTTDVSGLSPGINTFRWTISDDNASCPDRTDDVDIDVTGSLTLADAGPDQNTCDTFTMLNGNAVGAGEEGEWTVISGTGIFADASNPTTTVTGLSNGLNEFQWEIRDLVGTCPPSQDIVVIDVDGVTMANAGPAQNVCTSDATLNANATLPTEDGIWTVVSGTGTFVDDTDPNTDVTGLSIGNNEFRWTITDGTGTCLTPSESTVVINRLDPTDPLCGGTGVNCGAFTISVLEIRPSCTDNDDGEISFDILGGSGNYTVILTDNNGFTKGETGTSAASIVFQDLTAADYEYTVDDGAGNTCTLPYSLERQTIVEATATNFVDVLCFGDLSGQATFTIDQGGNAPYEYSIDGFIWNNLPPTGVVTDLPALGTYNVLIRDDAADLCPAQVEVTINHVSTDITLDFIATEASCDNGGGTLEITSTGGGVAPYSYRLDGTDFGTLPPDNTFTDLTAGIHVVTVIDDNGCEKDFNVLVNAPGLVIFTATPTNPDCDGNGLNGSVQVQIDPSQIPGSYEAAISDNIDEDGEFRTVPSNGIIEFLNLSVGNYFVTVTSFDGCPNKIPVNITDGPVGLSFEPEVECFDNNQSLLLSDIHAADNIPFTFQIYRIGDIDPIDEFTLSDIPAGRVFRITSGTFLNAQGTYQIRMIQNQEMCPAQLESETLEFKVESQLRASIGQIEQSFPEKPTGSIWINDIQGGYPPYTILVEPGDGQLIDVAQNQTTQVFEHQLTELSPDDYEIYIIDDRGCEIFFSVTVPRDTEVFIPNIFTPNGDDYNDSFYIRNLPTDGAKLYVSNRLGRKIYQTDNYQNDWDAEGISDGIYFYNLVIGEQKFSGWVEVWRGGINK